MPPALQKLLGDCTVQILDLGVPNGTGFFVAPGVVLTCAHVVSRATALSVRGRAIDSPAAVIEATETTYPDVALLSVKDHPGPCVMLDARYGPPDACYAWAFVREGAVHARDSMQSLLGVIEGWAYDRPDGSAELIKLKDVQIVPGSSGSALLNMKTGGVCGMVNETRSASSSLGGYAVPISVVLERWPQIVTVPHNQYHRQDARWFEALATERHTPAPPVSTNLRDIEAKLDALARRLGRSLPAASRQAAVADSRKEWSRLSEFKFLLRDYETQEEIQRSLTKIILFVAMGAKEYLAGGRYEEFTFLCELVTLETSEGPVKLLKIVTHRPEVIDAGHQIYRDFLRQLETIPFGDVHFAERYQALLQLQAALDARMGTWTMSNAVSARLDDYVAVRMTIDGGAKRVSFARGNVTTDIGAYREKITTTSEALEFIAAVFQAGPILVVDNLQFSNLPFVNLYVSLLDREAPNPGRVLFNVNSPEEWMYDYNPDAVELTF